MIKHYYSDEWVTLYHGDCLDIMPNLDGKSIDMILCDLPYGTTSCKWDTIIPFESLWENYNRLINNNTAIVLNSQEPFTSVLICSNLKLFRYKWIWEKNVPTGHLNSNRMPMKWYEEVCVFYNKLPIYNHQMRTGKGYNVKLSDIHSANYGKQINVGRSINDGTQYKPKDIIKFNNENSNGKLHPTQKPVDLFEYLIKTYTNENNMVLDNCAGSGTTGVACINLKRKAILIEKEERYCEITAKRCMQNITNKIEQPTLL